MEYGVIENEKGCFIKHAIDRELRAMNSLFIGSRNDCNEFMQKRLVYIYKKRLKALVLELGPKIEDISDLVAVVDKIKINNLSICVTETHHEYIGLKLNEEDFMLDWEAWFDKGPEGLNLELAD